jgi:hypothetical protein
MRTSKALMDEFASAFQFFDQFGENWYALRECLCYMDEWMKTESYVVLFTDSEQILIDEHPDELRYLLKSLDECGKWWSQPVSSNGRFNRDPVPFHSLFLLPPSDSPAVLERYVVAAKGSDVLIDIETRTD